MDSEHALFELNLSTLRDEVGKISKVSYNAYATYEDNIPVIGLNCATRQFPISVTLTVLKSDSVTQNGDYPDNTVQELIEKMKTVDFWEPIKQEIQQRYKDKKERDRQVLLARINRSTVNIQRTLSKDDVYVDLKVRAIVYKMHEEALLDIPPESLGECLSTILPIIANVWKGYKDLGLSNSEAGAILATDVHAKIQQQYKEIEDEWRNR